MNLIEIGKLTKEASFELNSMSSQDKNEALLCMAAALENHSDKIIAANNIDMENARKNNMPQGLLDRLQLNKSRIVDMADGIRDVTKLNDPIGEILSQTLRPNGLKIIKKRVPIGVIGIIYEARPNVTSDAAALCFKSGNATILKGGSDAINSNIAIADALREGLVMSGCNTNAISLIKDTNRATTKEFMKLNDYVDCLIPRGSKSLIEVVVRESTIPVIETGSGNCHIYVDESADINMTLDIIENAKTQRIGVCNACESLLVHESVAAKFLPLINERLSHHNVIVKGDDISCSIVSSFEKADESDWGTEYLDYKISVKVVKNVDEAIRHINKYSTKHSETIITKETKNADKFLNQVDSACVYHNASTRFTDGSMFGFGAEIGISTQKLHARGPMGLNELTSYKYVIYGDGQIR